MVVAETLAQALDAAEAVDVAYEVLPGVYHSEDAMRPGAPAVWDEVPDNVPVDTFFGDREATDKAFANADHVVAMDFHIDRVTGVPLEPRAALGEYDAQRDRYTLHVRRTKQIAPRLHIIALALADREDDVIAWAESGISGYIPRSAGLNELLPILDATLRGEQACSPRVASGLMARFATLDEAFLQSRDRKSTRLNSSH